MTIKINEITSIVMNKEELILAVGEELEIISVKYREIKRIEQKNNTITINNTRIEFNDFNSAILFFYSLINIKRLIRD